MILCAGCGLHFAEDGDHWCCVEWPDLLVPLYSWRLQGW
jgi:hypothetical protein